MKANEQLDRLIIEQSSEWLEAMKRGDAETNAAFGEWLLDSKRHTKMFLMMTALDRELERFDPERRFAVPNLAKGAEVVPLYERDDVEARAPGSDGKNTAANDAAVGTVDGETPDAASPKQGRRPLRWWSLAAAILVCALSAALVLNLLPNPFSEWQEYSTAQGEQRFVTLEDGSTVRLNTQSQIAVRMSGQTRDIRLLSGEAMFKVHHDAARPFRVHTSGAFIQAIGTQFNVYRRAEGTTVSVVEGRVRILPASAADSSSPTPKSAGNTGSGGSAQPYGVPAEASGTTSTGTVPTATLPGLPSIDLSAGEEAKIDDSGRVGPQERTDVARVIAWSERRLIFKQEALGEIVTQFNRYNRTPQFRVIGDAIAARRYSGAFNADDPDSLRAFLATEPDLLVEDHGDEIVVRSRVEARRADLEQ